VQVRPPRPFMEGVRIDEDSGLNLLGLLVGLWGANP